MAGWITAWKNARALDDIRGQFANENKARGEKAYSRDPRTGKETTLLSDPRSIRLVQLMSELDGDAEPGKPNPAFLKAAKLTLDDSLFHRRQRDFRLLMEKMRPEDAPAIHQQFKDLEREGKYFGPEYAAFAMRWGTVDGEAAMANGAARAPFERPFHDLANLITGWATADAEEALEWVGGNKEVLGEINAYPPLLAGWLATDPVAASTWLENGNLDARQCRECVDAGVLDKIYSDGLEGASEWLASLPDGNDALSAAAKSGWMTHISHLGNLDPALAAAAWGEVGSEPWMGPEEFHRFCGSVARGNQGSLDAFAEQLSKTWSGEEASAQFGRWTEKNPEAVGALLAQFPSSGVREAGIKGMLQILDQSDPTLAETLRKQLGE